MARRKGESSTQYEERQHRGKATVRTLPSGGTKLGPTGRGISGAVSQALQKVGKNGMSPTGEGVVALTITPEMAADLLGKNINNRKMRDARVVRIARDIQEGRWAPLNGETIKIARDGTVADGQHRLAAVLVADLPISTYVAFGVAPDAFETIDSGLKRSGADTLFVAGEENARGLTNAVNAMFRYLSDGTFKYRLAPSNQQLLAILAAAPGLRVSAAAVKGISARLRGAPEGVMGCLHYLFNDVAPEEAAVFFEGLKTGAGLASDSPIYRLRERFGTVGRDGHLAFSYQHEAAVVTVKAWNAFREGLPMSAKSLRYKEDEKIPEII